MRIEKVIMYSRILYCDNVLGSIFSFPNNLTFVSQCCSVGKMLNLVHIGYYRNIETPLILDVNVSTFK